MIADKYEVEEYKNTKHCENCANKKSDDIFVENKKEDNSILATVDKFALEHPVATVAIFACGVGFLTTIGVVAIISEGVHRGNMKTLYSLYKLTR